jgi:hypothetical protein
MAREGIPLPSSSAGTASATEPPTTVDSPKADRPRRPLPGPCRRPRRPRRIAQPIRPLLVSPSLPRAFRCRPADASIPTSRLHARASTRTATSPSRAFTRRVARRSSPGPSRRGRWRWPGRRRSTSFPTGSTSGRTIPRDEPTIPTSGPTLPAQDPNCPGPCLACSKLRPRTPLRPRYS